MSLDVYLCGEQIGTLFPAGENDYRLAYAPERVDHLGPGATVLSSSLPCRAEPYSSETSRAFVEGLLPEGARRRKLAIELGVDPADGYALIAEIGRDCAGGISFLPADEPPREVDHSSAAWVEPAEFEELLAAPPKRLFRPDREQRMRFALPGLRHKLALVRDPASGRWAWPEAGAPSTHIVKPETGEYPEFAANEMFCTEVFREAGLPVAAATLETIAGRTCLVSPRFDRAGEGFGATRIHQESFAQALGFEPGASEYCDDDEEAGPGFAESSGLLRAVGLEQSAIGLIEGAFANYVVGNGDAHGSNFALLYGEDGPRLAPFYDIASTAVYDDPLHSGMVFTQEYTQTVYLLEMAEVCEDCDIEFEDCRELAARMSGTMNNALKNVAERARYEDWYEPVIDEIVEFASERALGLGYEVEY